jgi:hypothetical protein
MPNPQIVKKAIKPRDVIGLIGVATFRIDLHGLSCASNHPIDELETRFGA